MTVKTIRFNNKEENYINKLLKYYHKDFSSMVKDLVFEKIEDLQDIEEIKKIKEGSKSTYVKAGDIDKLF